MDLRTSRNMQDAGTRNIGRFDSPVLVCGGAYSNLETVIALFNAADEMAIPASNIIHTGDAVAYCADPAATAALLRARQVHAIQGNVEESLAASLPDCGCGFNDDSLCDRLAAQWFAYADARIDDDLRRWMGLLPRHLAFGMSGRRVRVVHGGVNQINRYIFASQPEPDFEAEFSATDADMIIAGHGGIPFTRLVGDKVWHNSGSLGLPANDGTPRVWFSVLTPEADGLSIAHHALDYDHETARAKMIEAGVACEYANALATGLWPGLDVLPGPEKNMTGKPLDLGPPVFVPSAASASV